MSDTLQLALVLVPCLIVAIVFHEVAHGWTALALGDPTAKEQRRLSLNPIRHVDPVGTLLVPGALALFGGPIFGWAKPVPVNFRRLDNPRTGMMLVGAAGPAMNFLLAALAAVTLGLTLTAGSALGFAASGLPTIVDADGVTSLLGTGLLVFILINTFLALFNLLPIPPFDGSHIVEGLLPRSMARHYAKLRNVGMLLFIALIAATWAFPEAGILSRVIGPPVEWVLDRYLALATLVAGG
ncbi:site-2 protease family protein [Tsuneonella sp. YG55]|uniref:Site-2 protease family protein n=1 Tax=Tsuneonella litorea TaxID=2976475 RepID=A0A9X3ANC8_9SPHN|nr:site-2 protease family protein [Tsuneonella litorea]MCT2559547.1 site-2 protease family protein [Tsuneonella litorea]